MSLVDIRAALEVKLAAESVGIATAWEDDDYSPNVDTIYQQAYILYADTENPCKGNSMYRERGIFYVKLNYPNSYGTNARETRAQALKTAFYRGLTLTSNGVKVIINKTPSITDGIVKIEFFAEIFT